MQAPIEIDAYTVFDVYGEYRFSQKVRAFADLRNIFNAKYTDVMGFTTRPVNFLVGVNVTF
jgi:vitamin B12 transporter